MAFAVCALTRVRPAAQVALIKELTMRVASYDHTFGVLNPRRASLAFSSSC
jgi:hypothetical protein